MNGKEKVVYQKNCRESDDRIVAGSLFHGAGPVTADARSRKSVFGRGTWRSPQAVYRSRECLIGRAHWDNLVQCHGQLCKLQDRACVQLTQAHAANVGWWWNVMTLSVCLFALPSLRVGLSVCLSVVRLSHADYCGKFSLWDIRQSCRVSSLRYVHVHSYNRARLLKLYVILNSPWPIETIDGQCHFVETCNNKYIVYNIWSALPH